MSEANVLAFGDTNPIAKKIREMLGVGNYDEVRVLLPQFERLDGKTITYVPITVKEYDALKSAPAAILKDIDVGYWDEDIWLYPAEWYDYIPEGYEIVDIMGNTEKFQKGVTDDDRRFGYLAYGFRNAIASKGDTK